MSRAAFLPSRRTLALLALAAVVIGGAELLDDPDPAIRDSAKAYLFRLSQ
jgi:hypothetical protein